jgi:hypothetical protein
MGRTHLKEILSNSTSCFIVREPQSPYTRIYYCRSIIKGNDRQN